MRTFTAVALSSALASSAYAGRLDDVRREVQEPEPDDDDSKPEEDKHEDATNDSGTTDDVVSEAGAELVWQLLIAPFSFPYYLTGDDYGREYAYQRPYAFGDGTFIAASDGKPWALPVSLEAGYLGDDLWRSAVSVRLDTPTRLSLDATWNEYVDRAATPTDVLGLAAFTANFRFAQSTHTRFYAGLGGRLMQDGARIDGGWHILYGVEIYPMAPLVLSGVADVGRLGHAMVAHARATLGFVMGPCELFGGWDGTLFGETKLGGAVLGMRLWL